MMYTFFIVCLPSLIFLRIFYTFSSTTGGIHVRTFLSINDP
ncbi:hypothetical protein FBBNIHIM_04550 [Pseudocitrobacter vendiensis]|uniref:Uncharacterized protein n=1 Tax=Pseudocitrobacter vendiensis TaxID=2488306 RepID=A0ABM9F6D6_9ENTR|nr:hypothetical protein FBBNIHIM_04550 [Pseudocitrobacter vendiensis]